MRQSWPWCSSEQELIVWCSHPGRGGSVPPHTLWTLRSRKNGGRRGRRKEGVEKREGKEEGGRREVEEERERVKRKERGRGGEREGKEEGER